MTGKPFLFASSLWLSATLGLGAGSPTRGSLLTYKAPGTVDVQAEVPAAAGRPGHLLLGYSYDGQPFDVVSVDPATRRFTVLGDPGTGDTSIKSLAVLPNGTAYFGTAPLGHILKLAPNSDHLMDLGRPGPHDPQMWIWDLALAEDGKIYGVSSPSTKLIQIDPATDQMRDLGAVDTGNTYSKTLVAGGDGKLYIAVGVLRPQVFAYDLATGQKTPLLPLPPGTAPSTPTLYKDAGGRVIIRASVGNFEIQGGRAVPLKGALPPKFRAARVKADLVGHLFSRSAPRVAGGSETWADGGATAYTGKPRGIFRLSMGTDGQIYCSAVFPGQFFKVDPATGLKTDLALLGPGEVYQMLPQGNHLLMAAYSNYGDYHLLDFDTARSAVFAYDGDSNALTTPKEDLNPAGLAVGNGIAINWRPKAMVLGPDGAPYIGSVPGYGKTGGFIIRWERAQKAVQYFPVSEDLSVVSLCATSGVLVAGLSTEAGTGGKSPAKEGQIVVWNPVQHTVVYQTVPVPGANQVNSLVALPDGRVYGVAGLSDFFEFDVATRRVTRLGSLPLTCNQPNLYSAAGIGPDGNIYGLAKEGVYRIDTRTNQISVLTRTPDPITAGFSIAGNRVYYACGATLAWSALPSR